MRIVFSLVPPRLFKCAAHLDGARTMPSTTTVSNADLGIPDVLTVKQTSFYLKIHERTVRAMIKDGRLKAAQHGRIIRIPIASIREFLGL
jgi:excisionase family DNA binding protein